MHTPDEDVPVENLTAATKIYAGLAATLAAG
jgi:acetylornithine deacetylase/succinyl-diaminopimelate desuccinylase-like protein